MKIRNISAALANPTLGLEYLGWRVEKARTGNPAITLANGAKIAHFANFSEYHSMKQCISHAEQRFFVERVASTPGDIIDIGANVGVVSIPLALKFPDRTIHALEPAPTTFATLSKNVALNAVTNVKLHRVALADVPGVLAFNADPVSRGTARIATADDQYVEEVEATTLDLFVARNGITDVALLKIDVEGFESVVFSGGRETLAKRLPRVIFMEVCASITRSAGFDPAGAAQAVADAGYTWFDLTESGELVAVVPAQAATVTYANWVALPA